MSMDEKEPIELIELDVEEYEYEDEEEEDEELGYDDPVEHETRVAWDFWQLPNDLSLPKAAADMYLLYDMNLDDRDEGRFQTHITWLSEMFGAYSDMAVGGELRYTCSQVTNYREQLNPSLVDKLIHSCMGGGDRHEAWEEWAGFRSQYGTDALRWAEEAFRSFSSTNTYGGVKWAHIAETLRKFEEGEYSALMFVDMCWSTEHNGGQFFGKLWSTYGIKPVLDANQREDMDALLRYASTSVQEFYVGAAR